MKIPVVDQNWESYRARLGKLINSIEGNIDWTSRESMMSKLKYLESRDFKDENILSEDRDYVIQTYDYIVRKLKGEIRKINEREANYKKALEDYTNAKTDLITQEQLYGAKALAVLEYTEGSTLADKIKAITQKISDLTSDYIDPIIAATNAVKEYPDGAYWLDYDEKFKAIEEVLYTRVEEYRKILKDLNEEKVRLDKTKELEDARNKALNELKKLVDQYTGDTTIFLEQEADLSSLDNINESSDDKIRKIKETVALLNDQYTAIKEFGKYADDPEFVALKNKVDSSNEGVNNKLNELLAIEKELKRRIALRNLTAAKKEGLNAFFTADNEGLSIKTSEGTFTEFTVENFAKLGEKLKGTVVALREYVENMVKAGEQPFEEFPNLYRTENTDNRKDEDVKYGELILSIGEQNAKIDEIIINADKRDKLGWWINKLAEKKTELNKAINDLKVGTKATPESELVVSDQAALNAFVSNIDNRLTVINAKDKLEEFKLLPYHLAVEENKINKYDLLSLSESTADHTDNWDNEPSLKALIDEYNTFKADTKEEYDRYKTIAERLSQTYEEVLRKYSTDMSNYVALVDPGLLVDIPKEVILTPATLSLNLEKVKVKLADAYNEDNIPKIKEGYKELLKTEPFQIITSRKTEIQSVLTNLKAKYESHLTWAELYVKATDLEVSLKEINAVAEEVLNQVEPIDNDLVIKLSNVTNTYRAINSDLGLVKTEFTKALTSDNTTGMADLISGIIATMTANIQEADAKIKDKAKKVNEHLTERSKLLSAFVKEINGVINTIINSDNNNTKLIDATERYVPYVASYTGLISKNDLPKLNELKSKANIALSDLLRAALNTKDAEYDPFKKDVAFTKEDDKRQKVVDSLNQYIANIDKRISAISLYTEDGQTNYGALAVDVSQSILDPIIQSYNKYTDALKDAIARKDEIGIAALRKAYNVLDNEINNKHPYVESLFGEDPQKALNPRVKEVQDLINKKADYDEALREAQAQLEATKPHLNEVVENTPKDEFDYLGNMTLNEADDYKKLFEYFVNDNIVNHVTVEDLLQLNDVETEKVIKACREAIDKIDEVNNPTSDTSSVVAKETLKKLIAKKTALENTIKVLTHKKEIDKNNQVFAAFNSKAVTLKNKFNATDPYIYPLLDVNGMFALKNKLSELKDEIGKLLNTDLSGEGITENLSNKLKEIATDPKKINENVGIALSNYNSYNTHVRMLNNISSTIDLIIGVLDNNINNSNSANDVVFRNFDLDLSKILNNIVNANEKSAVPSEANEGTNPSEGDTETEGVNNAVTSPEALFRSAGDTFYNESTLETLRELTRTGVGV